MKVMKNYKVLRFFSFIMNIFSALSRFLVLVLAMSYEFYMLHFSFSSIPRKFYCTGHMHVVYMEVMKGIIFRVFFRVFLLQISSLFLLWSEDTLHCIPIALHVLNLD